MKRGQSTIEFFILVMLTLFFFMSMLLILANNVGEKNREKLDFSMNEIALGVRNEISLAIGSVNGYKRNFNVPLNIDGRDYDISLIEGFVYISLSDASSSLSYRVSNVTGQIQKGNNLIRKDGGKVYLNS